MSWRKIPQLAKHLGLSVRTTRELIKSEVIPVTRLPSGTILGNLDLIDQVLLERGDEVARKEQQTIDKVMKGLR